ncbi:unnamed protein product [Ambrosiozyma monospora]|uniref:Unnamed protein product n=1 Tax=Ambrosiozyma monospora TaxID=43982 RepID=A0ACB5TN80_AMBMO|nr:unnamed protein product [Ambrosiozyma monospora]
MGETEENEIKEKLGDPTGNRSLQPECSRTFDLDIRYNHQKLDSFPPKFNKMEQPIASSFAITDRPREMFIEMDSFVSRYCRGDDREELKDELYNLKSAFESGWYDSDSDYDD